MHSGYQGRLVSTLQQTCPSNSLSLLVDSPLKDSFQSLIELTMAMLMKISVIVLMTPIFMIPSFIVGALGRWIGQIYLAAQLSVKREMSNAKAPVVGQ